MKSLCLFASYFTSAEIPYYITVYLKELKSHFFEVVLLSSQKNLSAKSLHFLESNNITLFIEDNEGFDFGLWYKACQKININEYEQIALVNDSAILFKSLNPFMAWAKNSNSDVQGMTFSESISPHLQSYFLVLNKKASLLMLQYFNRHEILKNISDVIITYEVGLSKLWLENGLQLASFVDNNGYAGEFSPYYHCLKYHLEKGIPLIKKKIIYASYRKEELFTLARMNFKIEQAYYLNLISEKKNLIIDTDRLKKDIPQLSFSAKFIYNVKRLFFVIAKPLYKSIRAK